MTTGPGFVIETKGGVSRRVCDDCGLLGFLSDNRRVLGEVATVGKTFVVRLTPGRPGSIQDAQEVEEPTTTGRPAGRALDAPILYLLLDADGFRCVWAQRVDAASGRLQGRPYPVRHFHGEQMLNAGGVSTSFGNAANANGFLYEAMATTGDIWRLRRP